MPRRHTKEQWRCPARDCQGGNHRLQTALKEEELARIPERDRAVIEETRSSAFRCHHCGFVYLHDSHLDMMVGFLDGAAAGDGWHPVMHPR